MMNDSMAYPQVHGTFQFVCMGSWGGGGAQRFLFEFPVLMSKSIIMTTLRTEKKKN